MFTGIITHMGTVASNNNGSLKIKAPLDLFPHLTPGMSIAVNGICLTVTKSMILPKLKLGQANDQ